MIAPGYAVPIPFGNPDVTFELLLGGVQQPTNIFDRSSSLRRLISQHRNQLESNTTTALETMSVILANCTITVRKQNYDRSFILSYSAPHRDAS